MDGHWFLPQQTHGRTYASIKEKDSCQQELPSSKTWSDLAIMYHHGRRKKDVIGDYFARKM